VKDELKAQCQSLQLNNKLAAQTPVVEKMNGKLQRLGDAPIYTIDAVVRRATALQKTADAMQSVVHLNSQQAKASGVMNAQKIKVTQADGYAYLPIAIDENIPDGCVWIAAATDGTIGLGATFGAIEIEPI
jgi:NADH-quinone oxidoreductase subunit G